MTQVLYLKGAETAQDQEKARILDQDAMCAMEQENHMHSAMSAQKEINSDKNYGSRMKLILAIVIACIGAFVGIELMPTKTLSWRVGVITSLIVTFIL